MVLLLVTFDKMIRNYFLFNVLPKFMFTHPEHFRLFLDLFRVSHSLVFCVVLCRSLFVFFLLDVVLSVRLRIMASD
jgi:hypothetical protein